MPSASSPNSETSASNPDTNWLGEADWIPGLRGAIKGAIQERDPRNFAHALTVRPPFAAKWPKSVRRDGDFPLELLARQGVQVLDGSQPGAAAEFLTDLHDALSFPKRERRIRVRDQVEAWTERLRGLAEVGTSDILASLAALVTAGSFLPTRCFLPLWKTTALASQDYLRALPAGDLPSAAEFLERTEIPCWIDETFWPLSGLSQAAPDLDARIGEALTGLLGADGTIHAAAIPELPAWIGTFLRCQVLDRIRETPRLSMPTRSRLTGFLVRATSLLGFDGDFPWTEANPDVVPLLSAAARVAGLSRSTVTRQILQQLVDRREGAAARRELKTGTRRRLRELRSFQSDWGRTASLSSDCPDSTARILARYHDGTPELLVEIDGLPLLRGAWQAAVAIEGQMLDPALRWECACWHSEPGADFAELNCTVRPGVLLSRQILLARKLGWLLLVDEVQAPGQLIEYSSSIPVVAGWQALEDAATREFAFVRDDARIRVCPLDLPQDKVYPAGGTFQCSDDRVRLARRTSGGMYAATLYEWHSEGREAGVDWNALTVADDGRVMTSDEAVGFRIRIGERQSVFYHSLTRARVGRSVLGLHTLSETIAGTFTAAGIVDPILEVEFSTDPK